jgi:two-component system, sensor histidine kinase PdtaS
MEIYLKRLPEHADAMAIALISTSYAPLLLLTEDLTVIAASDSFCLAFGLEKAAVTGKKLAELGSGEWNVRQLDSLLKTTVSGDVAIDVYEMDLQRQGRKTQRLLINAHILDYFEAESIRLVMSVTDVTAERQAAKELGNLVREKQLLLEEIQHRVANSLQIISSVLLQSARAVQSTDTRQHLQDAHNRVMSIAMLQKHLPKAAVDSVALPRYFTDLCASIGASMISDPDRISLTTDVDDSIVDPDTSVSLGLIVTELIINALKHAFPDYKLKGNIFVQYHRTGASKDGGWELTVADDGVGMANAEGNQKPGLGTGIVAALSANLEAVTVITDQAPGTKISITHPGSGQTMA